MKAITSSRAGQSAAAVFKGTVVDPKMDPKGVKYRESRDNKDNPNSLGIVFALDISGSMASIPVDIATKQLPGFMKLLTDAKAANPKLKLVLCEPFGLPVGKRAENWEPWAAGLRQRGAVVAKLAQKHGAALVLFQRAFDEAVKRAPAAHWIWDSVHPTYNGHQIMADEWERAVSAFWAAKP